MAKIVVAKEDGIYTHYRWLLELPFLQEQVEKKDGIYTSDRSYKEHLVLFITVS